MEVSLSGGGVGVVGVGLGVVGVGFGGVGLVVVGEGLVAVGDGVVVEEDGVVAEGDGFVVEEGLGLVVEDVLEVETLVGDVAGPDAPSVPAGLHAVKPIRPAAKEGGGGGNLCIHADQTPGVVAFRTRSGPFPSPTYEA